MDSKELDLKVTRLVVVAIVIVLLSVISSCVYTVNQPGDLTCEKLTTLNEHQYSLQECRFFSTTSEGGYNLVLTIDEVR